MQANVNLSITPHYQKSFRFFYLAILGLFICGCYLIYANNIISTRWDVASIVTVHLFTLGFLLPIFLGAITQLMPVLFGIADFNIKTLDKLVVTLPIISTIFLYGFHHYDLINNWPWVISLIILWIGLLKFIYALMQKAYALYKAQKKIMYIHLLVSCLYFALALMASIWLVLVHFGINLPYFRPHVTNIHLTLFILGFFYHLFISISQHIIPMFFITQPTPQNVLKRQLLMPLFLTIYFVCQEWPILLTICKVVITYLITEYLLQIYWNLKTRKRKNKDPVIYMWNFFMSAYLISLFLWISLPFVPYNFSDKLEVIFGANIFFGTFLTLILSMLVKIIPFLLWQDLSRLQMEKMNFQTPVPNLKDFIGDKDIKHLLYQLVFIVASIYLFKVFMTGILLIVLSMHLVYLIIMAQKLHQNAYMAISNNET